MQRPTSIAISAILLVTGVSCTGTNDDASPGPETGSTSTSPAESPEVVVDDLASFTDSLESSGSGVRVGARSRGLGSIFGVRGQLVTIDGDRVTAFEYPTEVAADRLRSSVSKDAYMVGDTHIDWSSPHLYDAGSLIVLYLGRRAATERSLEGVLGKQFAPR